MIRAKIEEYRVTKQESVLSELKENVTERKALAFLFSLEKENYKDEFCKEMQKIFALKRDVDGLFVSDEKNQEELLAEVLPLYTLYETELNKKEHYNDIVNQCRRAVKKYPKSEHIFMMLAEVLEYFSEQIFEHYKTIQRLLWEQYEVFSEKPTDKVCYALAKGCFYKAFLAEKYEEAVRNVLRNQEEYPLAYYAVLRLEKRFERN